jgi:hypothetical protein
MRHLLVGVAAIAALTISVQVGAQTTAPSTATAPSAAPVQSMNRMPAGGRATSERGATGTVTRAQKRHAAHAAKTPSAGTATSGSTTH